ncbi:YggS family pyridoxal phosphate-dependent enzyme [Ponticaulis sp.]|uniref:YggS family pyridoxal phosphate-dependent enzyme n=1 Tax=Ponticaulis sp. TaxID=2020902 RepID=UPI000B6CD8BA|nr:YggS family pyridoxal phosphate-dependent enzyme [Ponticaulis sp.]MAI90674.1 YggS family pyridoxal phosphate-dependent enzyme [Ponticaulis sp.]OUX99181.1 MAG: YggS family pyridoxal phosphate enzyme [Hyphomonadaceae bacterium TMED5]|tara:strand:+ start:32839 stop:33501 length:663 start_codon:yes stop_codon:yes gene_type:complete
MSFAENLAEIEDRILKACQKAERETRPELVAVSKRQPDERIEAALAAGVRIFGENRVQEAQERWATRREKYPDLKLRLIGPLQSNKSEDAVALFDTIDVLDRPKLARTLADAIQKLGKSPEILVQVNTGEEPQKAGVLPGELEAFLTETCPDFGISPVGLMAIPPAEEPPGPHFALLAKLAARYDLKQLSMGMSGDFETAILYGATHVRVGSALFGERDY